MTIKESSASNKNKVVRVAGKLKATKFSGGPEYKFVFKIESTTSYTWRAFFAESFPAESLFLLDEVRQEKKARYRPVYFHRFELDIVCHPSELSSILDTVKSVILLANEKYANHESQLKKAKEEEARAWQLAKEEEDKAEKTIQKFFAKLKL